MKLTTLLIIAILLLMVITGCNEKIECPRVKYPNIEALDKVPYYDFYVVNGSFNESNTTHVIKTIRALRISENYYYTTIENYRKNFINQAKDK